MGNTYACAWIGPSYARMLFREMREVPATEQDHPCAGTRELWRLPHSRDVMCAIEQAGASTDALDGATFAHYSRAAFAVMLLQAAAFADVAGRILVLQITELLFTNVSAVTITASHSCVQVRKYDDGNILVTVSRPSANECIMMYAQRHGGDAVRVAQMVFPDTYDATAQDFIGLIVKRGLLRRTTDTFVVLGSAAEEPASSTAPQPSQSSNAAGESVAAPSTTAGPQGMAEFATCVSRLRRDLESQAEVTEAANAAAAAETPAMVSAQAILTQHEVPSLRPAPWVVDPPSWSIPVEVAQAYVRCHLPDDPAPSEALFEFAASRGWSPRGGYKGDGGCDLAQTPDERAPAVASSAASPSQPGAEALPRIDFASLSTSSSANVVKLSVVEAKECLPAVQADALVTTVEAPHVPVTADREPCARSSHQRPPTAVVASPPRPKSSRNHHTLRRGFFLKQSEVKGKQPRLTRARTRQGVDSPVTTPSRVSPEQCTGTPDGALCVPSETPLVVAELPEIDELREQLDVHSSFTADVTDLSAAVEGEDITVEAREEVALNAGPAAAVRCPSYGEADHIAATIVLQRRRQNALRRWAHGLMALIGLVFGWRHKHLWADTSVYAAPGQLAMIGMAACADVIILLECLRSVPLPRLWEACTMICYSVEQSRVTRLRHAMCAMRYVVIACFAYSLRARLSHGYTTRRARRVVACVATVTHHACILPLKYYAVVSAVRVVVPWLSDFVVAAFYFVAYVNALLRRFG
jgi:hypothetical protein